MERLELDPVENACRRYQNRQSVDARSLSPIQLDQFLQKSMPPYIEDRINFLAISLIKQGLFSVRESIRNIPSLRVNPFPLRSKATLFIYSILPR